MCVCVHECIITLCLVSQRCGDTRFKLNLLTDGACVCNTTFITLDSCSVWLQCVAKLHQLSVLLEWYLLSFNWTCYDLTCTFVDVHWWTIIIQLKRNVVMSLYSIRYIVLVSERDTCAAQLDWLHESLSSSGFSLRSGRAALWLF